MNFPSKVLEKAVEEISGLPGLEDKRSRWRWLPDFIQRNTHRQSDTDKD